MVELGERCTIILPAAAYNLIHQPNKGYEHRLDGWINHDYISKYLPKRSNMRQLSIHQGRC
jgi:hypothetical protein